MRKWDISVTFRSHVGVFGMRDRNGRARAGTLHVVFFASHVVYIYLVNYYRIVCQMCAPRPCYGRL